jgi:hypothetical protein
MVEEGQPSSVSVHVYKILETFRLIDTIPVLVWEANAEDEQRLLKAWFELKGRMDEGSGTIENFEESCEI